MNTQEKDIKLAITGDPQAFERLYNQTIKGAYYVSKKFMGKDEAAEDVLQDAYIKVYKKINTYKSGNFQGWVDTIVANTCRDHLKKENPLLFSQMEDDESENYILNSIEETNTEFIPDIKTDYTETKRMVMDIIDALPVPQRMSVVLFYYEQMNIKEIANVCECSDNTIKSRLNYGKKYIKTEVEKLESKGIKLHCAPIFPFLLWLFAENAKNIVVPSGLLQADVLASIKAGGAAASATTAESAATAATAAKTGGIIQTTGLKGIINTALEKIAVSLTAKIAIGVTAAVLVTGTIGIIAATNHNKKHNTTTDVLTNITTENTTKKQALQETTETTTTAESIETTTIAETTSESTSISNNLSSATGDNNYGDDYDGSSDEIDDSDTDGNVNASNNSSYASDSNWNTLVTLYQNAYYYGDTASLTASQLDLFNHMKSALDAGSCYSNNADKEKGVHDWIVNNCTYDYDNYNANTIPYVSYTMQGVFINGVAVCNGYQEAFKMALNILNIPCETVNGTTMGQAHAWNMVNLDGEWYQVDITWDDPVTSDRHNEPSYRYFNITDEQMSNEHRYTPSVTCNSTRYGYLEYFAKRDKTFASNESEVNECLAKAFSEGRTTYQLHITDAVNYNNNIWKTYKNASACLNQFGCAASVTMDNTFPLGVFYGRSYTSIATIYITYYTGVTIIRSDDDFCNLVKNAYQGTRGTVQYLKDPNYNLATAVQRISDRTDIGCYISTYDRENNGLYEADFWPK